MGDCGFLDCVSQFVFSNPRAEVLGSAGGVNPSHSIGPVDDNAGRRTSVIDIAPAGAIFRRIS